MNDFSDFAIAASRGRIARFALRRPSDLSEACAILADPGGPAIVHAGGIDVANRLKRGAPCSVLVDISGIEELAKIDAASESVVIGATVRHRDIELHGGLLSRLPAFRDYLRGLGNIRIRMQGTIGGNLMAREPAYEIAPLLLALGAELEFVDCVDRAVVRLSIEHWLADGFKRSGARLLTRIHIPVPPGRLVWSRDLRPNLSLVAHILRGADSVTCRVAIGGEASGPRLFAPEPSRVVGGQADLVESFQASMESSPEFRAPYGPSDVYCRRVLPGLFQRLVRASEAA